MMDAALQWHIRLQEPEVSTDIWTEFAVWLAQDERHNLAYDAITQSDHELEPWVETQRVDTGHAEPVAANNNRLNPRWFSYGGIGLAASVLLTIFLWPLVSGPEIRNIKTDPGQTQIVELEDGSRIHINGDSEISLKSDGSRYAELQRGEAIFYVVHDAGNPFTVISNEYELIDRGTIFNVKQAEGEISIDVSEGAVLLKGKNKLVDIQAGKSLTIGNDGKAVLKTITLANVGSWTRGQLVYDLASVSKVVEDVNRSTGMTLTVDPAVAGRQFSGTIQLEDEPDKLLKQLELLLKLRAQETESGWHLTR